MSNPRLGPVVQVCWYVNDIEAAMRRWIEQHGVGPFFVHRHMALEDVIYRGRPTEVDFDLAIAQSGGIQLELIQPVSGVRKRSHMRPRNSPLSVARPSAPPVASSRPATAVAPFSPSNIGTTRRSVLMSESLPAASATEAVGAVVGIE